MHIISSQPNPKIELTPSEARYLYTDLFARSDYITDPALADRDLRAARLHMREVYRAAMAPYVSPDDLNGVPVAAPDPGSDLYIKWLRAQAKMAAAEGSIARAPNNSELHMVHTALSEELLCYAGQMAVRKAVHRTEDLLTSQFPADRTTEKPEDIQPEWLDPSILTSEDAMFYMCYSELTIACSMRGAIQRYFNKPLSDA